MSDIAIPGVTDRFNSAETIQRLMEVERRPLDRVETEVARLDEQRGAILDLNRRLASVRDSAKELFGFRNPFDEKLAASSDASVVTASAARSALESTSEILIRRTAAADRFASRSLPTDYRVAAGRYEFAVGEDRVVVPFNGGSLADLAGAINARGGGAVSGSDRRVPECHRAGPQPRVGL